MCHYPQDCRDIIYIFTEHYQRQIFQQDCHGIWLPLAFRLVCSLLKKCQWIILPLPPTMNVDHVWWAGEIVSKCYLVKGFVGLLQMILQQLKCQVKNIFCPFNDCTWPFGSDDGGTQVFFLIWEWEHLHRNDKKRTTWKCHRYDLCSFYMSVPYRNHDACQQGHDGKSLCDNSSSHHFLQK